MSDFDKLFQDTAPERMKNTNVDRNVKSQIAGYWCQGVHLTVISMTVQMVVIVKAKVDSLKEII